MGHLISSKDMTRFVAYGYLKVRRYGTSKIWHLKIYVKHAARKWRTTRTISLWARRSRRRSRRWRDLIHSMIRPAPLCDRHAAHLVRAHKTRVLIRIRTPVIDFRQNYFGIQLWFFPVDTTDEMGGHSWYRDRICKMSERVRSVDTSMLSARSGRPVQVEWSTCGIRMSGMEVLPIRLRLGWQSPAETLLHLGVVLCLTMIP